MRWPWRTSLTRSLVRSDKALEQSIRQSRPTYRSAAVDRACAMDIGWLVLYIAFVILGRAFEHGPDPEPLAVPSAGGLRDRAGPAVRAPIVGSGIPRFGRGEDAGRASGVSARGRRARAADQAPAVRRR